MTDSTKKTFCVLPWIHSFVNSNGAYQVCCTSEEHHEGIPDNNNINFNISNQPKVEDVMNSNFMKELRLKMLKGEWSEVCTRCFETERLDGVSRRNIENHDNAKLIQDLISKTENDGAIKPKFKSLDYRLGNRCNLQCRMCGVFSSDKWIKDWNKVKPGADHLNSEQIKYYENFNWVDAPFLISEMVSKIDSVERIHFAGGEPLLSPQMSVLLKECIKMGVAKKIILSYNTNITVLPGEVLTLWREFKEVRLLCSVDGFEVINDYIRPPSKWSNINKNLEYLDKNASELGITEILLSCTVQIYNILSLDKLYAYLGKFEKIVPALNLINLHYPDYLSTKVLPVEAKKISTKRLIDIAQSLENKLGPEHQYLIENIHQIIKFMNEHDLSSKLVNFKKMNSKFDEIKDVKIHTALPELSAHLTKHYLDHFVP